MTTASTTRHAEASVAVDLVIFTVRGGALQVLLIERGKDPFLGMPALPGGYVRENETLDQAAVRELAEETGVASPRLQLEQLRAYGDPARDPRGHVVTIAYLALCPGLPEPVAGTDASSAQWATVRDALAAPLAFDHAAILGDAVERARAQLEYTTAAAAFCPEPFTVTDLRQVYEAVWDLPLDPSNFRRKVTRAASFIEATGDRRLHHGRPAALYRRGPAHLLSPPLLRAPDHDSPAQVSAAASAPASYS
jgi:8-oxo-dGTP diphosphatase